MNQVIPDAEGEGRAPLISVLMSVKDTRPYVAEAVESILAQTLGDFEFVIIDDGSTDGSGELLEGYAARDPRIRLTRRPNAGLVRSLNEMLAQARGRYVARMDADDVARPDRLELQARFLDEHPDHVLVGSSVTLIDPDGEALKVGEVPAAHEDIDRMMIRGEGQSYYHPSVMMRRDAVVALGGYCEDYPFAQDLDLFLKLAEVGRLANLGEALLSYREHDSKISFRHLSRQVELARSIREEAHRRRGLPPSPTSPAPSHQPCSVAQTRRSWAWWALGHGNLEAARKHARAGLLRAPLSLDSWRLVFCVMRGR